MFKKDLQYIKFCSYGFLKNLKFFEPFLILYFREAGISFLQIGFLFTIRAVAVNILEIPSGIIADGIGRRKSMILSFISYILAFLIFFLWSEYWIFTAAMLFFSFGEAFRTGTHKAMILDYLNNKGWSEYRTHYYGHTRSWSQRGSAVSALIAAALVFYSGSYRSAFVFTLIPYLLELALMISYPAWLDGNTDKEKERNFPDLLKLILREMKEALKTRERRNGFLNSAMPNGFFEAAKDYIQPLLAVFSLSLPFFSEMKATQGTAVVSGVIYSTIFMLTSIASGHSGAISKRLGPVKKQLDGSYLTGMSLLIIAGFFYHLGFYIPSIFIFITYYAVQNFRRPVAMGFISAQIDDRIMATGLSADSQLKTLCVAILAPVIGFLSDTFSLGIALAAAGVIGVMIFPFLRLTANKS